MKKLLTLLLILIPVWCYGYTEWYCDPVNGSNLNSGTDTNAAAFYTTTSGNWNSGTFVFTPTDGSNPVTAGVAVGQIASVYTNGATDTAFCGTISAVTNAANGTITVGSTGRMGTTPTTATGTLSLKVGGAWQGPHGAVGWPITASTTGGITTASVPRVNFKNNGTYSISAALAVSTSWPVSNSTAFQGYSSTPGDGGKATIDTGTNAVGAISTTGAAGITFADLIFQTSATTGASIGVTQNTYAYFFRCVVHGFKSHGFYISGGDLGVYVECESYGNTGIGFANAAGGAIYVFCYSHGNTSYGYYLGASQQAIYVINSISDSNGTAGILIDAFSNMTLVATNCDFYNTSGDGISEKSSGVAIIRNCNFIKNTGKGINVTGGVNGYANNNGYGAGTMANGSADTLAAIVSTGAVTYASGVTPWNAPTTGDFSIVLAAAQAAGRGAFTETSPKTGTVGYPDIGAAQSKGPAKPVSVNYSQ